MKNAKIELIESLSRYGFETKDIKCARIEFYFYGYDDIEEDVATNYFNLYINHTNDDVETLLNDLNFKYDNGYGTTYFDGIIWLKDDTTWFSRWEYDGAEGWEYNKIPEIPNELKKDI